VSADGRFHARVEEALRQRFNATDASVMATCCEGRWRARAYIAVAEASIIVEGKAKHQRKRQAVRSVALAAGLLDEDFAEPSTAPAREAVETQLALGSAGGAPSEEVCDA